MTSDTYSIVTTTFRGVAPSGEAIFIERPKWDPRGGRLSVPRSLLHAADDLAIKRLTVGDEFTFRVMDWKARELGFE